MSSSIPLNMTLIVVAVGFSETSVTTCRSAWHNIPDNLKAVKKNFLCDVMPRDLLDIYRRLK